MYYLDTKKFVNLLNEIMPDKNIKNKISFILRKVLKMKRAGKEEFYRFSSGRIIKLKDNTARTLTSYLAGIAYTKDNIVIKDIVLTNYKGKEPILTYGEVKERVNQEKINIKKNEQEITKQDIKIVDIENLPKKEEIKDNTQQNINNTALLHIINNISNISGEITNTNKVLNEILHSQTEINNFIKTLVLALNGEQRMESMRN